MNHSQNSIKIDNDINEYKFNETNNDLNTSIENKHRVENNISQMNINQLDGSTIENIEL